MYVLVIPIRTYWGCRSTNTAVLARNYVHDTCTVSEFIQYKLLCSCFTCHVRILVHMIRKAYILPASQWPRHLHLPRTTWHIPIKTILLYLYWRNQHDTYVPGIRENVLILRVLCGCWNLSGIQTKRQQSYKTRVCLHFCYLETSTLALRSEVDIYTSRGRPENQKP